MILAAFFIKPNVAVGAAFDASKYFSVITFVNHTKDTQLYYRLPNSPVSSGFFGHVEPKQKEVSEIFSEDDKKGSTLDLASVELIKLGDKPIPKFKFWKSVHLTNTDQNIAFVSTEEEQKEYKITKDNRDISEAIGHGYRITVDGGGNDNPKTNRIFIQVYDYSG